MFRLDNVSVSYKEKQVLHNISLEIEAGEKVALIGPSGAGKTTLISRFHEMIGPRSALIHQHFALVPKLSVFHNVYAGRLDRNSLFYNLLNLVKPQKKEVASITQILSSLGMVEKLFEPVARLSGGQQQRVAVARALFRGSEVLLADEPVSSIDPHQAGAVLKLLGQNAGTAILSLHSVQLALENFERIVGLRGGRICFDLPADHVHPDLLSELFAPC